MALVVRLSEQGTQQLATGVGNGVATIDTNTEQNVRAVANVIQLKSGEGVVMAGLIGEREEEVVRKIPVLGDIPYLGFPFRSKSTRRQKTEVLIFLEASVLDRRPEVARAESYQDYRLGQPYVDGEFLENPLECGMYRVGFGSYLPPLRHGEKLYWERHHRKLRKIATHVDDVKE
jgi:type II secretory pathway component GspD/PulD (secretin)